MSMELILGTAEFNKVGYGGKPPLRQREVALILNRAWEAGIRTLDCADTYGTEQIEGLFNGFERLNKTRNLPLLKGLYYHYRAGEANRFLTHVSAYEVAQLEGAKRAIVPMSLFDTRFCGIKHMEKLYARSVFLRGELLEAGYTVKDCLSFVRRQHVDGIIVGVNSVSELDTILAAWDQLK